MCGIFGVITSSKEPLNRHKILEARDTISHRGPDDEGIFFLQGDSKLDSISPSVALAHRRLSIIDLSAAAHQPMTSECGRYTIVYNGEVYNYKELEKEIGGTQSVDRNKYSTNSDTEVILRLYGEIGADCLMLFRGMFAFAIWDDQEKTLFAARDRFGIKPLYYYKDKTSFIFSTEIKAIKHYKENITISTLGMDAFLRTGSVPAPLTFYNGVNALLPGHFLKLEYNESALEGRLKVLKYWEFSDLLNNRNTGAKRCCRIVSKNDTVVRKPYDHCNQKYDSAAKMNIKAALLDSVKAHLIADVEVGAFLSGGIDSTAIVSLMRQLGKDKIKTISIVFPDSRFDESKYSRLVAKKFNTEHIEIPIFEKDMIEDLDKIINSMDQPTIDGVNIYFISKAAKLSGLKVALSGLGGDELFGGYPSFTKIKKYQRIKNLPLLKSCMMIAAFFLKNRLPAKAIAYMKNPYARNAEYMLLRGLFTEHELKAMGWNSSSFPVFNELENKEIVTTSDDWTIDTTHTVHYYSKIDDCSLISISELESCNYMRNQLLRDCDVYSMAHSIEVRVPFVDHKLFEVVLPYLDSGYDKRIPKKMLIDAVGDIPDEIIYRPKMGFTFPIADWIKSGNINHFIDMHSTLVGNKQRNLKSKYNINYSKLDFDKLHWSRNWSLYVMNEFI